ncbi:MAG: phage holin family protein [Pseudomonadota bacterium]
MLDQETERSSEGDAPSPGAVPETDDASAPPPGYDESIVEELGAVIDDAKLYATAELAFQKTRAKLLGKNIGIALAAVILAIILLHISIIALAVGLVMALEPLVTIWGAIAIVVGVMLLLVGVLGYIAVSRGTLIGEMFASEDDAPSEDEAK